MDVPDYRHELLLFSQAKLLLISMEVFTKTGIVVGADEYNGPICTGI